MYPFSPVVDEVAELVDVMKIIPQELVQVLAMTTDRRARAFDSERNRGNGARDLGTHRSGAEPPLSASSRLKPPVSQTLLHDHKVADNRDSSR